MIKKTRNAKISAANIVPAKSEPVKTQAKSAPAKLELPAVKTAPVKAEVQQPQPAPVAAITPPIPQPKQPASISLELVKPEAKKVCVAGTFNGWKPEAAPLAAAGNGRWVGNLSVKPGRYEYLFVVDGQWVPDPNAKETVQNPFGGKNSVITVST